MNRGWLMTTANPRLDVEDYEGIAAALGINSKIVQRCEWENDQCYTGEHLKDGATGDPEEKRWQRMRAWVESQIKVAPGA
jgi:hypothetical protein